ncbi:hypothetical protein JYT19_00460 [Sulfobacillus acidophilus]|uniref:Uncharacterized protein n=1 Tax=Sulfobacillus acidophilus TaxID=53633 RepID=A0ABS3AVH9_9FIRM|nr:hypothetical protein [Sulfobacillus acidophilus]
MRKIFNFIPLFFIFLPSYSFATAENEYVYEVEFELGKYSADHQFEAVCGQREVVFVLVTSDNRSYDKEYVRFTQDPMARIKKIGPQHICFTTQGQFVDCQANYPNEDAICRVKYTEADLMAKQEKKQGYFEQLQTLGAYLFDHIYDHPKIYSSVAATIATLKYLAKKFIGKGKNTSYAKDSKPKEGDTESDEASTDDKKGEMGITDEPSGGGVLGFLGFDPGKTRGWMFGLAGMKTADQQLREEALKASGSGDLQDGEDSYAAIGDTIISDGEASGFEGDTESEEDKPKLGKRKSAPF